MLCRLVRSNPHRGGVAGRPGYDEKAPEAREAEERDVTDTPRENQCENHEDQTERGEDSTAPGA